MPKYGGVAILMQQDFEQIKVLFGTKDIDKVCSLKPLTPFNSDVCDFLVALSNELMKSNEAKKYSDVVSFAFFCRKANISKMINDSKLCDETRIGRGLAFHIAPSNVALNFAYSLVMTLLAGNASVVKLSSKDFQQTDVLVHALKNVVKEEKYALIGQYINLWQYPNEYEEVTKHVSSVCDIRVIWGGDNTISTIKQFPVSPRTIEVAFADRCSICLINSEMILKTENLENIIRDFYNDTYLMDQNACTSPFLIIWDGTEEANKKAQELFWDKLMEYISSKYTLNAITSVDKLVMACKVALHDTENISIEQKDNLLYRIQLNDFDEKLPEFRCAGGFFYEIFTTKEELDLSFITEKYQTLSYYGYEAKELEKIVIDNQLKGIDRIVPIGHTMDFNYNWDGFDLIRTFSRKIFSM